MVDISVIGSGYVGLTVGAVLAQKGHRVRCVDIDEEKIKRLASGQVPFYEPELEEWVQRSLDEHRLSFTSRMDQGTDGAEIIFVTVGTPSRQDGSPDLSALQGAMSQLAQVLRSPATVVIKSTVPVGTSEWAERLLNTNGGKQKHSVLFNPEFLREGSAVLDFLEPDRIIIGEGIPGAAAPLQRLYRSFPAPCIITERRTAELIKYASNAFLATRISFINELAGLCEHFGVDVGELSRCIGLDKRIGSGFLQAGIGYGGSCFPKDVDALLWMYEQAGQRAPLIEAVQSVNLHQRERAMAKLAGALSHLSGARVAVLGITFKPHTDDVRGSPAVDIACRIMKAGGIVTVYDPVWKQRANEIIPGSIAAVDPYQAADGADAVFLMTEWEEFRSLDWARIKSRMRNPVLIDGRNCLEPKVMVSLGFRYHGFGKEGDR